MATDRTEKAKAFLAGLLPEGALELLHPDRGIAAAGLAMAPPEHRGAAESAAAKVATGQPLTPRESFALEAIIIPDKRPAIDIVGGDYNVVHPLWTHLNDAAIKATLRPVFASIGRIELPGNPDLPYGGTGFVVGRGLLMTNRHVAEIFSVGLGMRDLVFRSGSRAGIDFLQEKGSTASQFLRVRDVAMIHPYWDMALLRVDGLDDGHPALVLSLRHAEDMVDRDVAVIGYPAFDPRNDATVQNTVFGGVYYVKRLQPGKLRPRGSIESFGKSVSAATHDSSTLGGNSGSAVIDPATGQVVALHFAGVYLEANYAVPTAELARDPRVVDAGLRFEAGASPEPAIWDEWWRGADPEEKPVATSPARDDQTSSRQPSGGTLPPGAPLTVRAPGDGATWTIPLEITVRVGTAIGPAPAGRTEMPGAAPAQAQPIRDAAALNQGPLTFRDHFLSLYQSAVADVAKRIAASAKTGATTEAAAAAEPPGGLVLAAERIAQASASDRALSHSGRAAAGQESPALEKMSTVDQAETCAALGWHLLQAKVFGDTASAERLKGELHASSCDPQWATTIEEYVKYFGPFGTRRDPLYVTPEKAGKNAIGIASGAKVALIGDWGTGAQPARQILQEVKALNPDVLIHLGDIYYSGTEDECRANFEAIVNQVFDRSKTRLPVYTLSGNHDMYCGGVGYYKLIKRLNKGPLAQPASFFCLRTEDQSWQLLAMDTGRHDYSPFSVTDVVTFVEPAEQAWLLERLQEFPGKTILLSHHQLFSAFSQIGKPAANGTLLAYNPKLQATYDQLAATGKPIAAWFWGHEHNLCIYQPYRNLQRGRCVGHSAIPVFAANTPYEPLADLQDPPQLVPNTMLSTANQFYTHGFAMLTLTPGGATADYYEDLNGVSRKTFSEQI